MTARRIPLSDLPGWPLYLSLAQAAAYVGVSPAVFQAEVDAEVWPKPVTRGAKGGLSTWDRLMLEESRSRLSGLTSEIKTVITSESEDEWMRRFSGATKKQQTKANRKAA